MDDGDALYSLSVLVARSRQPIPGFRSYHVSAWREHSNPMMEGGPALQSAGSDNGPESFAGFPAFEAARALRDEAVNHHKAHRLLGQIVGGADAGRGDEWAMQNCTVMLKSFMYL